MKVSPQTLYFKKSFVIQFNGNSMVYQLRSDSFHPNHLVGLYFTSLSNYCNSSVSDFIFPYLFCFLAFCWYITSRSRAISMRLPCKKKNIEKTPNFSKL